MSKAIVTIVIATYNRPDVLNMAIYSVVKQSFQYWKLYVIGDHCDDRTGDVVKNHNDKRIEYINIKERFGEQSGPNSIGIALAKTKYLAFLNHDDIWLQDHLEKGINKLETSKYNFYLGGTANSAFTEQRGDHVKIYVDQINTNKRTPSDFYKKKVLSYEPASSWILETSITQEIGDWHYFNEVYRVPIEDFILRAWRGGAKFYFDKEVTNWYVLTHHKKTNNSLTYNYQGKEHQAIKDLLNSKSADEIRLIIKEKYTEWLNLDPSTRQNIINQTSFSNRTTQYTFRDKLYIFRTNLLKYLTSNTLAAYLYKLTGLDLIVLLDKMKGTEKGNYISKSMLKRTGSQPVKPNKEKLIEGILKNR